jgi:hypothetical protein
MRRAFAPPIAAALLLTVGCGTPPSISQPRAQSTESPAPQVDDPSTDWNNPFGGIEVPGLGAAQQLLPFNVYEPQGLGDPVKVILTPPEYVPERRAVAFSYDTPLYGRVVVMQHFPDVPADSWEESNQEWVAMNGQPNVSGTSEFVTVRGGTKAFVTTSEDQSLATVFWLNDGVEFIVMGPALDRAKALEVAETI